jgi:hypothetical protein
MSMRVMVRSFEGWRLLHDHHGPCWRRNEVWSTWQSDVPVDEAYAVRDSLVDGGVGAAVIDERDYDAFCRMHSIR